MRIVVLSALLAAALAVPATPFIAPVAAQAPRDWTRTVVPTSEGGFRMGNPNAPVKVVEYLSLTCPHCADFARDGTPLLIRNYVRRGRVSLEYRNYVLNGIDMTASLVARCGGAASFFPIAERLFATQDQWTGRIRNLDQTQRTQLMSLTAGERMVRIAEIGGLTAMAAQHGVPAAQTRRCLVDEAGLNRLGEMAQAASTLGVTGTPTFFINGARVDGSDWGTIESRIRQAGG
ncbi:MAG: DsbA family protein [Allosphingosinicella sp.]